MARLAGVPDKIIVKAKTKLSNIEYNNNTNKKDALISGKRNKTSDSAKQLDLFNDKGNKLLQMINEIDISTITPIEAINLLNDIKQKIKI